MYAYIDRKKKLPVTTLLRAIGFETDRDILDIFNLADELKVTKTGLKRAIGRRSRCTCFEDMGRGFRG